jgi:hypothetical protein
MTEQQIKRLSFNRETRKEITSAVEFLVYDEEELITGWERVYTVISVNHPTGTPTKIRFGTGDKQKQRWHEEEPNPVSNVYYHTEREHHTRQHNLGVVSILGGCTAGTVVVIWEGYDKRIRER